MSPFRDVPSEIQYQVHRIDAISVNSEDSGIQAIVMNSDKEVIDLTKEERKSRLPKDLPEEVKLGDPRLDWMLNMEMQMPENLKLYNKWFWDNFDSIRPATVVEQRARSRKSIVGMRFSKMTDDYDFPIIGHWSSVEEDGGVQGWFHIQVDMPIGQPIYQWESLHWVMNGRLRSDAMYYIMKNGLIFQHPVWHIADVFRSALTVAREMDLEENRVAIEVMAENRMDFLGQMHTGDDSDEEDSEDSSEED